MTHHMINGFITGLAVVFGGIIIAAILSGPGTSNDTGTEPPTVTQRAEYQVPTRGVGGAPAGQTPDTSELQTAAGIVTDADSGEPLDGVSVTAKVGGTTRAETTTGADGRFELMGIPPGAELVFSHEGYRTVEKQAPIQSEYSIALEPSTITGRVFDAEGNPIRSATVASGDTYTRTDSHGSFVLEGISDAETILARASGYGTKTMTLEEFGSGFTLEPASVRGAYVSAGAVASDQRLDAILRMIERTELNALVVDVKDSTGAVHVDSRVELAGEIGAVQSTYDAEQVLAEVKERGIKAIARIAVFEDPVLAKARPDLAIQDAESGDLWKTSQGRAWVNPYSSEVWDYNAALIQEAIDLGFDAVHLSYVHFPVDSALDRADYGQENTVESRQQAINAFLDRAYEVTGPTPAPLSVDLFSTTLLNAVDERAGQDLVAMAERVDYVAPMLFPAHLPAGTFDFEAPGEHPYEAVRQSLQRGLEHLPDYLTARVRPWLQDFSIGPGARYSDLEVREQIDAVEDAELRGWLLWNSENYYHENALKTAK